MTEKKEKKNVVQEKINPDDFLLPENEPEEIKLSDVLNNEHFEENFNQIFLLDN